MSSHSELETRLQGWMCAALDGDADAYVRLLEGVAAMARGYFLRAMSASARTPEKAEDLVQDLLVALHRKKHLYRRDRPFLPWIFAVARYKLIDSARADARRPSTVAWEDWHEGAAARREKLDAALELEEILDGLPERQRRALVLAKIDGLPLAAVAERLEMSLAAVKVTIHRALKALRKKHGAELLNEDA
jgi:RNA polymerase sigma-70 factor, ECF subfamily